MNNVYITYAKRTPIGKLMGTLSDVRSDDLLAHLLRDLKSTLNFDLKEIDDVIVGCANQAGEDNRNIARMSLLLADYPYEVPGATINRLCASSLEALSDAYAKIQCGINDCVVVGGVESMTRAPYVLAKAESGFDRSQKMYDTTFGWRFPNPVMEKRFPLLGMGETAEEVASLHKISRQEQDQFALSSHQKAIQAKNLGFTEKEIVPLSFKVKKQDITVATDECPRESTTMEALNKLPAVFKKDGTVSAGNSSPMNDGAAVLLVVSETFLKRHNLTPVMRITGAAARGVHPNTMGLGPVAAVQKLCQKFQMKVSDFDAIELNEAFSAQVLGCVKELDLDLSKINRRGGAIALGHPLGASGARITTTLFHQMQSETHIKKGLATMCIGVGQGLAVSFERA